MCTTTTTVLETDAAHLTLLLKLTEQPAQEQEVEIIKKKISALVKTILDSGFFKQQHETIECWHKEYATKILTDLKSNGRRQLASLGICELLFTVLHPELLIRGKDSETGKIITIFASSAEQILKSLLPKHERLEQIVATYKKITKLRSAFAKVAILRNAYANAIEQKCDQILDNCLQHIQSTKQQIEHVDSVTSDLSTDVNAITTNTQTIVEQMQRGNS